MALVAYASSDDEEEMEVMEGTESNPSTESSANVTAGHSLFSVLPAPKPLDSLTDEPELLVQPSEKEISLREKPPTLTKTAAQNKKKKIIPLPSVPLDNSDNDDDDQEKGKSIASIFKFSSQGSSDLFGSLPAPKLQTTKEVNRPLLPHTLTKRPEKQKISDISKIRKIAEHNKSSSKSSSLVKNEYASDDDDKDVKSFFSFDDDKSIRQLKQLIPQNICLAPENISNIDEMHLNKIVVNDEKEFGTISSLVLSESTECISNVSSASVASNDVSENDNHEELTSATTDQQFDQTSQSNESRDDYQFPAALGRKRKRGKKEEIKVITVNLADHLAGSSLDMTKNFTVEQDMKSHSKKRNKDMPTSQQKRKHQITFLAHQAKERELELKNQWAENKFSKKVTQSKYGF